MSEENQDPHVPGHPTGGVIDDLSVAVSQHRAAPQTGASAVARPAEDVLDSDSEVDVTGTPALGSLTELRFAHHAHKAHIESGH